MRRVSQLVAVLLLFLMTPGLGELVDDAIHYLETGHTEHSTAHEHAGGADTEHGCSGTFHTCSCHHSPAFLLPPEAPSVADSRPAARLDARGHAGPADGVRLELLRPPAA